MEVHHHSHTARKKWTHYFWEFFMLFLAVFCGFLAEYRLEHMIEHNRGLQYVRSFVEDLKTDTANFSRVIENYRVKQIQLDNLYLCFDSIKNEQSPSVCLKNMYAATIGFQDLVYTDRTLEQLKNSGGLRLLDEQDADSIIVYDQILRYTLKVENTSLQEMVTRVRNTRNRVFAYSEDMETSWGRGVQPEQVQLISKDKELLNQFFNETMVYRFACRFQLRQTIKLKHEAVELLKFFTEKYHLR
ncbi:MAG TPA: hypothetical protein VF144_05455 [Chitinophagaceae bacterium]